jgi:hypothetical protein
LLQLKRGESSKPLVWGAVIALVLLLATASTALAQTVSVTIDPVGFVDTKTGVATISGTVTCPEGDFTNDGAGASVSMRQLFAHRVYIIGTGSFPTVACTGTAVPWSTTVTGTNGRFGPGAAHVDLSACDSTECAEGHADIRLKASKS